MIYIFLIFYSMFFSSKEVRTIFLQSYSFIVALQAVKHATLRMFKRRFSNINDIVVFGCTEGNTVTVETGLFRQFVQKFNIALL